jgi:hypothetical protein
VHLLPRRRQEALSKEQHQTCREAPSEVGTNLTRLLFNFVLYFGSVARGLMNYSKYRTFYPHDLIEFIGAVLKVPKPYHLKSKMFYVGQTDFERES